jgi:hypothetical protein
LSTGRRAADAQHPLNASRSWSTSDGRRGGSAASQAKKSHAKKRQPDLDVVMFVRA